MRIFRANGEAEEDRRIIMGRNLLAAPVECAARAPI
jgi:hypothetical protein